MPRDPFANIKETQPDPMVPWATGRAPKTRKAKTNGHVAAGWLTGSQLDRAGEPLPNLANAMLAMRHVAEVSDIVAYDEMLRASDPRGSCAQRSRGRLRAAAGEGHRIRRHAGMAAESRPRRLGKERRTRRSTCAPESAHSIRCGTTSTGCSGTASARLDGWLRTYLGAEDTDLSPRHRHGCS